MGSLLRSLRALVRRVDRFAQHRAATADERGWSNVLAYDLEAAYRRALTPQALASLAYADRKASIAQKTTTQLCAPALLDRAPQGGLHPLEPQVLDGGRPASCTSPESNKGVFYQS